MEQCVTAGAGRRWCLARRVPRRTRRRMANKTTKSIAETLDESLSRLKRNDFSFKRLSLEGLSTEQAALLAEALTANNVLATLDLWRCRIDEHGARAWAEVVRTNSSLTELSLRHAGITDVGARAIADALRRNSSITRLDLTACDMTDAGAKRFVDALSANVALSQLQLQGNFEVSQTMRAAIEEQLMPEAREQRIQEKLQREKEKEEAAADAAKKAKTFGAGSLRARRTGRPDSRSS